MLISLLKLVLRVQVPVNRISGKPVIKHTSTSLGHERLFVVAHNHPSGDSRPSKADKETTRQLQEAGQLMAIKLEDHVIMANSKYVSFRESGLLL